MVLNSPEATPSRALWIERLVLIVVAALYLWTFTPDNPNGDGWVYIRGVDGGSAVWNPNHLYMQPTGLLFTRFAGALGFGWSTFVTLKVLSGLATLIALALFHGTLARVWPGDRVARVAGTVGLFFSAHMLSMALAEEFYIIQLPVLCGVLWCAVRWLDERRRSLLVAIGLLLAVVTGIQINNAILAVAMGLWVGFESRADRGRALRDVAAVWGPGLAIGLPLVLVPYVTTAGGQGLVAWLTSYQGRSDNALRSLYGLQLTPAGIVKSLATLAYGFAISLVGLGDLGTYGETLLTGRALEFRPVYWSLAATGVLFAAVGLGMLVVVAWWWRTGRRHALGRLAVVWILSYLLFNFLWVDTSDQFWGPMLPGLWLLVLAAAIGLAGRSATVPWRRILLVGVSLLLALGNTVSVAGHRAFVRTEARRAEFVGLLRPGDLVVTTGWDDLAFLSWEDGAPYERIALMDLALKGPPGQGPMRELPERLRAHLASGRRVVVARVFQADREARPWEQMARLKWSRARIVELLRPFGRRPLGVIGSVQIDELTAGRSGSTE